MKLGDSQLAVVLIDNGFDPESVAAAIATNDLSKLVHTGTVSVQLDDPDE